MLCSRTSSDHVPLVVTCTPIGLIQLPYADPVGIPFVTHFVALYSCGKMC